MINRNIEYLSLYCVTAKTKKYKNLANTKTLSATDNFASTCFEHPKNEKNASANRKKHAGG